MLKDQLKDIKKSYMTTIGELYLKNLSKLRQSDDIEKAVAMTMTVI